MYDLNKLISNWILNYCNCSVSSGKQSKNIKMISNKQIYIYVQWMKYSDRQKYLDKALNICIKN